MRTAETLRALMCCMAVTWPQPAAILFASGSDKQGQNCSDCLATFHKATQPLCCHPVELPCLISIPHDSADFMLRHVMFAEPVLHYTKIMTECLHNKCSEANCAEAYVAACMHVVRLSMRLTKVSSRHALRQLCFHSWYPSSF